MVHFEWAAINTAAILGIAGFLWRQSRKVDVLYQAFFGVDGRNGLLRRLDELIAETKSVDSRIGDTRHMMRNELQVALLQLHDEFDKRLARIEDRP